MKTKSFINIEELITLMPGYIYWLDSQNIYQGCNEQQALAFGLSSCEEIIGKKNQDLPAIDAVTADIWDRTNLEVIKTAKPIIIEEPAISTDRSIINVLSYKLPLFDKNGQVKGLLVNSVDISDQKERELSLKNRIEQIDLPLEHIVSHLPGHVYWKDKTGVYLGCNDLQAKSLGLTKGEEVIGKTDFELPWGEGIAEEYRQNDLRIMETRKHEAISEKALIDNKEIFLLSQKTPLINRKGEVIGILGISQDITEQKNLEKQLTIAKDLAESANKLKSEFIYNMEHDIRTPFSGILGVSKYLEVNETDPEKKQLLSDISFCAQELLNYTCSILDFSRIESGTLPLFRKKFYLKDLIDDLVNIEKLSAQHKGLTLNVDLEPNLPPLLIGDDYRLKRILINLLSNAIKFTNKGFIRLKITMKKSNKRDIIVRFVVEDSGIGIAKEKLNMIYEKFSRLNPSNPGIYKGQGLGLRIVKQFVTEMRGDIEVKSVLGQGSSFQCTFPFKLPT